MKKTVFITGASSGFGKACAIKYAEQGYKLVLAARSMDKLSKVKSDLDPRSEVHNFFLDISDPLSIEQFFKEAGPHLQNLDILVNNAGLALGDEPAYESELDEWETMIDVNIKGLIHITRLVLPAMVARNSGHIVNIGSVAGSWPIDGASVYCSTKAFVQQFSRTLRCDLLGKNIRVTNIEPGMSQTDFAVVRMRGDQQKADKLYENTKPLSADDVADIITWTTSVPAHVNINNVEVMPTCQAWQRFAVDRNMTS